MTTPSEAAAYVRLFHRAARAGDAPVAGRWLNAIIDYLQEEEDLGMDVTRIPLPPMYVASGEAAQHVACWPDTPMRWNEHEGFEGPFPEQKGIFWSWVSLVPPKARHISPHPEANQ